MSKRTSKAKPKYDSDSSVEESDSSDDQPITKSRAKASPKKRVVRRKRKVESESEESSSDEEDDSNNQNEVKVLKQVQNRSPKEQLVADILCRWWYVLPDWPPADYDYKSKMIKEKLRLVTLDKWEDEPDANSEGLMKCYALTQFPGVYRDATGKLRDLRPLEGKPCFSELMKKNDKDLQKMLSEALSKQIEVLCASHEKKKDALLSDLKERLKNVGKKTK